MASLKFIMDVDDDQPGHPAAAGRDATRTGAPPHSSDQATPVLAYPTQASGSDQVATQPSGTSIAGSRRAGPSSRITGGHSAITAASSRSSNRRRSSASNDSTDYAGYGSGASSSSAGPVLNPTNTPMRPMPNLSSSDMPVKYTPVTGRVSRAKKGVPVHICEICRPPKTFTRAEHLRRHQLSHQTPGYPCTYPGCDRAFHRPDLLARHQSRHTEPGGDDTSALRGGGEEGGQSSLAEKSSHLDLANQTGLSTGISGGQVMSSDLSAPPSESPSTPDVFTHAPSLQPSNNRDNATNQAPSSGAAAGGNEVYGISSSEPYDSCYAATPAFSDIIPPSNIRASSASGTSYPSATDSFQQPQSTPSVFATQGVSLPSLSIPETNPPELYHPASPWTSSASDSTYSTPVSDNARNPHSWLARHRSPTGDWPSTHLLSPYPNPTSRDPSRTSLGSTSAAAPLAIFANPFHDSQLSTTAHDPSYDIILDVPMAGFDSTERGGQQISTSTSQVTFRPHHRQSASLSSIRAIAPERSGPLVTPMQAIPDRSTSSNTMNIQKDDLVDIANPHDTFMSDGPSLDIFGAFGGGYGNISPGGTGSAGGLLAALDLPMTGCGMTGVPSCQQLPRQVLAAVPGYVVVYWQKFHKLYPIVHRTTFETAGEDVLRWAMAAVATQYLDTKEDRLRGNQLHEHAWQELKRIPQWNLQVMQAILLCEIFARFRGRKAVTKPSKMFESVYSRVLYHNPTLFDATIPATDNAFRPEERWQAWVDAEARRRLLTACFITDVHASAYQQQKRAHEWDLTTKHISPTIPLSASSASLWDASSAAAWASILASDPESGIPTFAQTSTSLTPSDRDLFPSFDSSAILALELVHLPRLPTSTPPPPSLSLRRDDDDDATIEPLTRPRSTPGYSSTTINPPSNPIFPPSRPLATTFPPKTSTEERITALFPTSPRASTYLALHHTPLHDLLAVSGDTWIFSQKVLPAASFLGHQRRLKAWVEAGWVTTAGRDGGDGGGEAGGRRLSAARATVYAARAILGFLDGSREDGGEEEEAGGAVGGKEGGARWMVDLSDYWGLYVCALICWSFGHRAKMEGSEAGVQSGTGKGTRDGEAMGWLRLVSGMEPEEVNRVRGRREAGCVVGLVRRTLEWDCVGGRSRLYVDAVGVLKKLEEGVNWKWF